MKLSLRFSRVLPAALLGVLLSGAALAAGFYVSPPAQSSSSHDVGIDGRGNAIFGWTTFNQASGDVLMQIRRRSAAGVLAATQTLSTTDHDAVSPHVAVNSAGAAVAVWQAVRGDVSATTPVQGRTRTAGGALSPIFNIARPGGSFSFDSANPNVALDGAGNATFTWTGLDTAQKRHVYARRRSAGGTFGPTFLLSPPGVLTVRMAVNAGGTAVFVWVWNDGMGHNLIQARRLSAAGVLGQTKIIAQGLPFTGGGGAGTGNPQVGLDSQGNALIVWEQPDGQGPCGINGCPKIFSRTLSRSDVVGTVPQTYTSTINGGRSPQVAVAGNGSAVVTWVNAGIEFRTRSAGGALSALRKFSAAAVATQPVPKGNSAGNIVAVWQKGAFVEARALSAAGTLGPTRRYSINGQPAGGGVPAVGAGGDAVVAWSQPDGLGQCSGGSTCNRIGGAVDP